MDLAASPDEVQESIVRDLPPAPHRPLAVLEAKIAQLAENREAGKRRESLAADELAAQYPEADGFTVAAECPLRDSEGRIVLDPETGNHRRVDFCVVRDDQVVDSIEVTSLTAPKEDQLAKGARIRDLGGTFIRLGGRPDSPLVPYAPGLQTRVLRYP